MRLPLWFLLGAILIVSLSGIVGIGFLLWVQRWKS